MSLKQTVAILSTISKYDKLVCRWFMAQHSKPFRSIPYRFNIRRHALSTLIRIKTQIAIIVLAMTGHATLFAAALSFACASSTSHEVGAANQICVMIVIAAFSLAATLVLAICLKGAFAKRCCTENAIDMLPEIEKEAGRLRQALGLSPNSSLVALQLKATMHAKRSDQAGSTGITRKRLSTLLRTFSLESVLTGFPSHKSQEGSACDTGETEDDDDDTNDTHWRH